MSMTDSDIERLRAETPGCASVLHFNHAGASLPSRRMTTAMVEHLQREALMGPIEASAHMQAQLDETRQLAARFIGAKMSEIAFASSCSHAWGSAFAALPPLHKGDRILVGRHEWGSNLALMQIAAERAGAQVEAIPCVDDGSVDQDALAEMIDERVQLISLTWLPANGGLINDAAAIGKLARAAGVTYFVDAAQALGQVPIDVEAMGCDVLTAPVRKHLRGPRGLSLLYAKSAILPTLTPAIIDVQGISLDASDRPRLADDATRLETQENSRAGMLGLREALLQATELGVASIRARIRSLAELLRAELKNVKGVELRDLGSEHSALVSFTLANMSPSELRSRLHARGINIGANGVPYTPLDMRARGLTEIARLSVSYLHTTDEIERVVAAVREHAR